MIKNVIFDWKRTLYDPDNHKLIEGAEEILKLIKDKKIPMILIGKGGEEMNEEVERLGLKNYFADTIFVEGQKDPQIFKKYIDEVNPKNTLIIGDRVRSELEIGNMLNTTTIWFKQGKFAQEEPLKHDQIPTFTIYSLKDLIAYF